jgi:hypothetical protein
MRHSRLLFCVLLVVGLASWWAGATYFHPAKEGSPTYVVVYPPKGPCSVGLSFEYPGDSVTKPYEACDIRSLSFPEASSMSCQGGMSFSVDLQGCVLDGMHQPWRYGLRGYCALNDVDACQNWQHEATLTAAG